MAREYKVSIQDDVLTPEETLFDAGSEFSDLERPIPARVFKLTFWGVAVMMAVILGVSFKFGVIDYEGYAALAFQNRTSNFSVPAPRGVITDAAGEPLVRNVPSFDLVAVSKEIKSILDEPDKLELISRAIGMSVEELTDIISTQSTQASVFTISSDMSKDKVLAVQYLEPAGMHVVANTKRQYIDGPIFSQIVGYIGKVNKDDLNADSYYTLTDSIGRLGIEGKYEKNLRGDHGRLFFSQDTSISNIDAKTGDSVALNIDGDLQRELYTQARNIMAEAGLSRGAAVIQDPRNGAVLALVSFPSFDNNAFSDGLTQKQYDSIFNNSTRPLFNRVIAGLYNPGSTIKPLMGLMGLEEKTITTRTTIQDCISITIPNPYNTEISYVFKNWRADTGIFNLRRAIAESCNVFFYSIGGGFGKIAGLGAEKVIHYLQTSLADRKLGIDLVGEESGFVPTPEWKESTRGEQWYQGDTFNISIGQGDLLVTPLWLNAYISAIANGGTLYQPQIAKEISDVEGKILEKLSPKTLIKLPFSQENLAEMRRDMEETVISGTSQVFKDLPVRAAAKTGTAEVAKGRSINALFTVFAPAENPEVAMTVLVEGAASNQGYATRIAHAVLKWYFNRDTVSQ